MSTTKRLLIADTEGLIRRGLRALFGTRPDLELVAEASSGHEAVTAASQMQPDVAIVAYAMPELNGGLLCRHLRKAAPGCHILIYSRIDQGAAIREALKAGASGFVLKSDSEVHIVAGIEAVVRREVYFSPAVSAILRNCPPDQAGGSESRPTPREQEVIQLVAEGRQNKQVAARLGVSIKTIEAHRAAAMRKLKLHSTAELVRYALRNNIVAMH